MELFLFPIGQSVLHPGAIKPLNVFEKRYIEMVQEAVSSEVSVVIGYADESWNSENLKLGGPITGVRSVAGFGRPDILDERPDGSLLVNLQALGKVKMLSVASLSQAYVVVNCQKLTEQSELSPEMGVPYLNLQRKLVNWIGENVIDQQVQNFFVKSLLGPTEVVGASVSYLIPDPDLQQLILECDDINKKIDLIMRISLTPGSF